MKVSFLNVSNDIWSVFSQAKKWSLVGNYQRLLMNIKLIKLVILFGIKQKKLLQLKFPSSQFKKLINAWKAQKTNKCQSCFADILLLAPEGRMVSPLPLPWLWLRWPSPPRQYLQSWMYCTHRLYLIFWHWQCSDRNLVDRRIFYATQSQEI